VRAIGELKRVGREIHALVTGSEPVLSSRRGGLPGSPNKEGKKKSAGYAVLIIEIGK